MDDFDYNIELDRELCFIRDRATYYLSLGNKTEKELRDKLSEFNQEKVDLVIKLLKGYKYIDDELYAKNFALDSFNLKSRGKRRIYQELLIKGVNKEIIQNCLDEYIFNEKEKIEDLLYKKTRGNRNIDDKEKNRLFNFFIRRGFSPRDISDVLNEYVGGEEYEY